MKYFLVSTLTCLAFALSGCGGSTDVPPQNQRLVLRAALESSSTILVLPGNRGGYSVSKQNDGYTVARHSDGSVTHANASTTHLQFADVSLALDTATAGKIYRLYQAAFGRIPDTAGIGYWLAILENGTSLEAIAQGFIQSDEFQQVYGKAPTDQDFVIRLYANVLHRAPDSAGLDFWLSVLKKGVSRAVVLVQFSESTENTIQVAPSIADGVPYAQLGIAYAPVANLGSDIQTTVGKTVPLDGSDSSDANGDKLSFSWTLSRPAGSNASLTSTTDSHTNFVADIPGEYVATLKVSDGHLTSESQSMSILVTSPVVAPVADNGTYKCSQISHSLAMQLFLQGHTYLDRDHDGKPCEASDIAVEIQTPVITPTTPSSGMCYVNGYYRKNGTYVKGYWRRC